MIRAVLLVTLLAATLLITGPGAEPLVWKVALGEVADRFATFADITSKLYIVPGVRLFRVTECDVVSVGSSVEDEVYVVVTP